MEEESFHSQGVWEEGGVSKYNRKGVSLLLEPLISTNPQGDFFSPVF